MGLPLFAVALMLFAATEDFLGDAIKALDSQQPAMAEALLRKAVAADADDYAAHFHLALALSLQNKDEEGIGEYQRTLQLKPGLFEADLNLGMLLLRNKRAAEAVPVLKEALVARPADVRTGSYLAQALLDSGDAAGAEAQYAALAQADAKNTGVQTGLAKALLAQSKLAEAAEAFRRAGSKDGMLEVAAALEKRGQTNEAIAIYKQFPDDAALKRRAGQLLIDSKNADAAIADLEEVVKKAPTPQNRLALADAYKLAGETAKVLEQLQAAVATAPYDYSIRMALGRQLRDNKKLLPAAQQFGAATKLQPDSVEAWNELATALLVTENYTEGLMALDHVKALGKELPGNHFLRAITLDKLKMQPQAVAEYQVFLEASKGALPDQEFQARQRIRIIELELKKKR